MDDIRNSFSKMKKDLRHRLGGKKHAPDRVGADTAGESDSLPASLSRQDPRVIAGSHDDEGSRISADLAQAHSGDRSQPKPIPADGDHDDPQGRKVDVEEKDVRQRHSRLDPDVEGAAGSGPNQEIERASPLLSVTPIPPKREFNGAWALSPQSLCLTIRLDNADTSAVPDMPQDLLSDENARPGVSANEKKSSWKSTAFATAKLLLRGVRESADAFGPLKSVAGGLCFILENCEVWSALCALPQLLQVPQRMKGNEQTIESLAHRVKSLAESLRSPVSEDDVKEHERRKALER